MIIDHYFSNAQSLAGVAIATNCTNIFDTGVTGGTNAYEGEWIVCQVETAFTCAGSNPTLDVAFVQSANADLSASTTLYSWATITEATLVDKYLIAKFKMPRITARYFGFVYTPSAAYDAGKIDAIITPEVDYLT